MDHFEEFMVSVYSDTFNTRPSSAWPQPLISKMCVGLVGKMEIVAGRELGVEPSTTHNMLMEEFMDAKSIASQFGTTWLFFPKGLSVGSRYVVSSFRSTVRG